MPVKNYVLKSIPRNISPTQPFQELIKIFLEVKTHEMIISKGSQSEYTIRDYRYQLQNFLNWMATNKATEKQRKIESGPKTSLKTLITHLTPTIAIGEIDTDTIRNYLVFASKQGKSKATISTWLYTLKSFFRAVSSASGGNIKDPASIIKRQAFKYEKAPHLNLKHSKKFLNYLLKMPIDPPLSYRDKVFFLTMIKLGLRMNETLGIKKSDITFQENHLIFSISGKGQKKRTLPLPLYEEGKDKKGKPILISLKNNIEFAELLKEYLTGKTGYVTFLNGARPKKSADYIFLSKRGLKMSHDTARNSFNAILSELRLSNFGYTPHSLRHTAVTNWLYSGVDLETASKLAGHANISTTERIYSHTEVKKLSEGLGKGF